MVISLMNRKASSPSSLRAQVFFGEGPKSSNPLELHGGLAFVELTGNSREIEPPLERMGFTRTARSEELATDVFQPAPNSKVIFLVHDSKQPGEHGGLVSAIGLYSDNLEKALKQAEKFGISLVKTDGPAYHQYGIEAIGKTKLFLVPHSDHKKPFEGFLNQFKKQDSDTTNKPEPGYEAIDHITLFVPASEQQQAIRSLERLGFSHYMDYKVQGDTSGMENYVLQAPGGTRVVLVSSDQESSPINNHVKQHAASYHHIALLSNKLLAFLKRLSSQFGDATPAMPISDAYYKKAFEKFPGLTKEECQQIKENNLVISGINDKKNILQLFTKSGLFPGGFSIELIQRKGGLSGFELPNVTALLNALSQKPSNSK